MPSQPAWRIVVFEENGVSILDDYLSKCTPKEKALILNVITYLRNLGPEIQGTNMDKLIEGPIRELRKDRHRILYARDGTIFILLNAFLKRTQKTPRSEITLAKERFTIYLKRREVRK